MLDVYHIFVVVNYIYLETSDLITTSGYLNLIQHHKV